MLMIQRGVSKGHPFVCSVFPQNHRFCYSVGLDFKYIPTKTNGGLPNIHHIDNIAD